MLREPKPQSPVVVDLTDKILVRTEINQENHAALRAGFAGYPANPRWNINKYRAWKTGQELKKALARGEMVVRSSDSMLVALSEQESSSEKEPARSKSHLFWSQVPNWLKHPRSSYQTI